MLFEKALNDEGWMSRLGGEIQMWLALAYQARCDESIRLTLPYEYVLPLLHRPQRKDICGPDAGPNRP